MQEQNEVMQDTIKESHSGSRANHPRYVDTSTIQKRNVSNDFVLVNYTSIFLFFFSIDNVGFSIFYTAFLK